jgi:hypothetical protein
MSFTRGTDTKRSIGIGLEETVTKLVDSGGSYYMGPIRLKELIDKISALTGWDVKDISTPYEYPVTIKLRCTDYAGQKIFIIGKHHGSPRFKPMQDTEVIPIKGYYANTNTKTSGPSPFPEGKGSKKISRYWSKSK